MVVKPATKTPLTALLLAEVLAASGTPPGQINFVTCENAAAAALIHDERVKKITFTGSPAVGWKLKEQCGKKRITLELGGNAGVIVHEDASHDLRHSGDCRRWLRIHGTVVHQRQRVLCA
jgi:glyceraldehyde-3-phosphate dehydrogenase (NADP+)